MSYCPITRKLQWIDSICQLIWSPVEIPVEIPWSITWLVLDHALPPRPFILKTDDPLSFKAADTRSAAVTDRINCQLIWSPVEIPFRTHYEFWGQMYF